ncbi:amidohydrolase family protein [Myxococcus xanthus]|uniref:amidohydrolase n=1 Tax=Myxococcus xanthus TaxID=34 RepID=UPI001916EEC7|nr:amidohydrolase family protein [Myxococcus xanthus]QQR47784.1 amidohydrolase family protein [Myxococcus xanthus]
MFPRFVAVLAALLTGAPALAQSYDIYENGKVFTSRDDLPYAEAFAVRNGKVVAVGSTQTLRVLYPPTKPHVRRVDLGGRTVIPGLIDAHSHVATLTRPEYVVGAPPSAWAPTHGPTAQELWDLVAARAAQVPFGTPIVGFYGAGLYEGLNSLGMTARAFLDSATTTHPVFLVEWSGHAVAANSAAIDDAGLRDFQPDPYGGWRGRDELGRYDGVFQEFAVLPLVKRLAGRISDAELTAQYAFYDGGNTAQGVTETHDFMFVDEDERFAVVRAGLPRPSAFQPNCIITREGKQCAPGYDGVIRRKIFVDGTQVSCSAWVPVQYLRPELCPMGFGAVNAGMGIRNMTDDQVRWVLEDVLVRGGMVSVHAIGREGIKQILRLLEERDDVRWGDRVSIEHFVMPEPGDPTDPTKSSDVERAARLGISVVVTGTHNLLIPPMMTEQHPGHLLVGTQPHAELLAKGIRTGAGSDAFGPAAPSIWFDILGLTAAGQPVSVEQAVRMYTRGSAEARMRNDVGTLAAGKRATFAVLSQDVFTVPLPQLPDTTALLTVVDGQVVHSVGLLAPATP